MHGISIHASLAGGDLFGLANAFPIPNFNPRLPRGRRRSPAQAPSRAGSISIHASLAGGDDLRARIGHAVAHFNPRLPRGRRQRTPLPVRGKADFNPRLPRGRRRSVFNTTCSTGHFNPRLPRGRRRAKILILTSAVQFQSTPPSREATRAHQDMFLYLIQFQSTPPSREATICAVAFTAALIDFNPRLPRGRRPRTGRGVRLKAGFQSTPPSREATARLRVTPHGIDAISIHASLAGGDGPRFDRHRRIFHFNPRLPRGRRPC